MAIGERVGLQGLGFRVWDQGVAEGQLAAVNWVCRDYNWVYRFRDILRACSSKLRSMAPACFPCSKYGAPTEMRS